MHRYRALAGRFPAKVLASYDAATRELSRRARFSNRVLKAFDQPYPPFEMRASADTTEILLYDEIGYWGVTAKDFVQALAQAGDGPITLRINSPGGDVFDGYAIYNALRARTAPVNVVVDGIAASAASFIAMAGATIAMGEAAMIMIHNAQGFCMGDRRAMGDMVTVLGKIDDQIAAIYAAKAGAEASTFTAAMDAETWYTSTDAIAAGLADSIIAPATQAPIDPAAKSSPLNRSGRRATRAAAAIANKVAPYDPDNDGDNDAQQAIDSIRMGMSHFVDAIAALNGGSDDDPTCDPDDPDYDPDQCALNASLRRGRKKSNAATTPEWQCSAARDLPIDADKSWDGPAAAERLLDDAGFNGDSPDPAKAKRSFLAWDHHNPKLKASYKLPFADLVDGKLTALKSGLDAAASRLPDTDIPDDVKTSARAVIDHHQTRIKPAGDQESNRLRISRNRATLMRLQ